MFQLQVYVEVKDRNCWEFISWNFHGRKVTESLYLQHCAIRLPTVGEFGMSITKDLAEYPYFRSLFDDSTPVPPWFEDMCKLARDGFITPIIQVVSPQEITTISIATPCSAKAGINVN